MRILSGISYVPKGCSKIDFPLETSLDLPPVSIIKKYNCAFSTWLFLHSCYILPGNFSCDLTWWDVDSAMLLLSIFCYCVQFSKVWGTFLHWSQFRGSGLELACERECSRGDDYRLIKLNIVDFSVIIAKFSPLYLLLPTISHVDLFWAI